MPFLSHSLGPQDAAVAARLRAVAAVYGIRLELPDRTQAVSALHGTSPDTEARIARADVVIGLVTHDAVYNSSVVGEINRAIALKKPVILLLESGTHLQVPQHVRVVHFNRSSAEHEHQLMAAINAAIENSKRSETYWLAGIALGLVGLAGTAALAAAAATSDE